MNIYTHIYFQIFPHTFLHYSNSLSLVKKKKISDLSSYNANSRQSLILLNVNPGIYVEK